MKKSLPKYLCKRFLFRCTLMAFILPWLFPGGAYAQTTNIRLDMSDTPIITILNEIEKTTPYRFFYSDNVRQLLQTRSSITRNADNINSAMTVILRPAGLSFEVNGHQVSIIQRAGGVTGVTLTGIVTNEKGEPVEGVSVMLKSNKAIGTATDKQGRYSINVPGGAQILVFSSVGFASEEVTVTSGRTTYNVRMNSSVSELGTVVIQTGIFERDKVSFTGSTSTIKGEDLRLVGGQNIVQSLRTLDPSFVVLDNLAMGSDPNTMASIELRGQGSPSLSAVTDVFSNDPNRPLFILNGVEVPLQVIIDLDINRVASVTILKDAGSTALYGSRGANGVVVVETLKPQAGEVKLYYNGGIDVQMPDLSVFNMMNATEKLEFERLSGKYTHLTSNGQEDAKYQQELNKLYASRLNDVLRGVDTYWLSEPVRTGLTHSHAIRVSVGQDALLLDVGADYKNEQGVMKGSNRETWSGNILVNYREGKINISNNLMISGFDANGSNYGNFSDWVNASPYFTKYNESGGVDKFLQYQWGLGSYGNMSPISENIPNPLYNASLNSKDNQNQVYIQNTLQIQYDVTDHLRMKGGLDLSRTHYRSINFTPSEHTKYYRAEREEKGEYINRDKRTINARAHFDLSYGNAFGLHSVMANTRVQIKQDINELTGYTAVGFPDNSKGTPNLAKKFTEMRGPEFLYKKHREVNLIGSVNYNYDLRYLLDLSVSMDGASTFGANRKYKSFWSTGIGWNINREEFAAGWGKIDLFKLRASMGTSGNQNIGSVSSYAIYQNFVESNRFGVGYFLSDPGNPNLPWQVSRNYGIGLDFSAKQGKYSLTVDLYHKKTDPNIIFIPQAPSTGVSSYAIPMGWVENKGLEFIASYSPIYNLPERIMLTFRLTGAYNRSKFGDLDASLNQFNEALIETSVMRQYRNGYSPTSIWAVKSKGIDPSTGEEVFIRSDGSITYTYDANDMVVVGDERPDLMGVASAMLRYREFTFNMSVRYSVGSDIYNSALYNKVENMTVASLQQNQDKRALYSRWQKPGDRVSFRAINIVSDNSPKTSRFVQKNNFVSMESISVGYELLNKPWVKQNLGMQSLRFMLYANDIFRWETSKSERGYEYPFARRIMLSINASF